MTAFLDLCLEVMLVVGVGGVRMGNTFSHFDTPFGQGFYLDRVIGHEPDLGHAQQLQNRNSR